MDDEVWIVIPNWAEFQHYPDRDPVWIKNYRRLLSKPEYLKLTFAQRGLLHTLWLLYAESDGKVPANTLHLSRKCSGKVFEKTLASLNDAGFIEFSASKPLALTRVARGSPTENHRARGRDTLKRRARARAEKKKEPRPNSGSYKPYITDGEVAPVAVDDTMLELAHQQIAGWNA